MAATSNQTATTEVIGDGNSSGTQIGQSATDLIGFHGATPSDQYAVVTNTSGTLGDTNAAVDSIIALLQEKGLMAS
jgi:hypothetical protein